MTPATYNFDMVRGSAGPSQGLTIRLKTKDVDGLTLIPMLFDDIRISIYDKTADKPARNLLLRASHIEGQIIQTDEYNGEVSWIPTTQETRALLVGAKNFYEFEVRHGTEEVVYVLGVINGIGGLNDDESDAAS